MLSPNPLSLLCALLLCLPLALVFTINTPNPTSTSTTTTTTTTTSTTYSKLTTITTKSTRIDIPFTILASNPNKTHIRPKPTTTDSNSTTSPPPPPPPSPPPPPPPPPIRVDYEDDDLLLRAASRVNPKPKSNSPRKLAFMFLTTTAFPFSPLWQLYFNNTPTNLYNIYIHTDPSLSYNTTNSLFHGVFAHRVIPSKPTRRLTPTLSSAARRLLAHALLDDPLNSHFALLSASCIPLHSFKFTYKTVISSRKSFIEILENEEGAYERWAARGEEAMLPEVAFESFRIGSQFWVITRKHAKVVVSDRRMWAKFKLPCLRWDTCYPEENYFPTLLNTMDPRGCVTATLTHVDWTDRLDGHPRTYVARDVGPDLILRLRSDRPRYGDDPTNGSDSSVTKRHDPFLFARKFSPKSLQPLMGIANDLIFKED